jgi:hypothetical protein
VLPVGRLADQLRAEQYKNFRGETWLLEHLRATSQNTGEMRSRDVSLAST